MFRFILLCLWLGIFTMTFADLTGFSALLDGRFFYSGVTNISWTGLRNILFSIFRSLAVILFIVAVVVAFIAAIRLFLSDASEENFQKWIYTLVWSAAGLLLAAFAYGIIVAFERQTSVTWLTTLNGDTVFNFVTSIIYPLINFLRYIAATCFFLAALYAFYRMIVSVWNEEGFQSGKSIFFGAALGFVIMLLAEPIVKVIYWWGNCDGRQSLFGISTSCVNRVFDLEWWLAIIIKWIVFLNGFIALVTLLMIMYAGALILINRGDEEKIGQAKRIIMYAIIGVFIILFSYVLYRGFMLII